MCQCELAALADAVPDGYRVGEPPTPFEREVWRRFWKYALDPAERSRVGGTTAAEAAVEGARSRLRPILMTSAAMIAGMMPMALSLGQGGGQATPLGRAVVGGLAAATVATLFVLPSVFAMVQARSHRRAASLDPNDDGSSPDPSSMGS